MLFAIPHRHTLPRCFSAASGRPGILRSRRVISREAVFPVRHAADARFLPKKILPAGAGTVRNLRNYGILSGAAGGRKAKFSLARRGI